jgi:imidazolonepropionase-like amidohydrolase
MANHTRSRGTLKASLAPCASGQVLTSRGSGILNNGNVEIGTTAPTSILQIAGRGNASADGWSTYSRRRKTNIHPLTEAAASDCAPEPQTCAVGLECSRSSGTIAQRGCPKIAPKIITMKIQLLTTIALSTLSAPLPAQQPPPAAPKPIIIKAGRLLDVHKGTYLQNAAIWIDGDKIKEVGPAAEIQAKAPRDSGLIDLGSLTILPGLIDCHTHIMASKVDDNDGYILNLAKKSQAFRALEGASNARKMLEAGYTTIRDVENEGSAYADVALRDAINQGLVPGPRMQVSTRAIAAVGQYEPFGISPDLENFPTGAQLISGSEEARRAVREQIGHGADLIKVYADWRYPTLTVEELTTVVEEAHRQHRKVAAHATTPEGIRNALAAGVDSIEHGHFIDRSDLERMKSQGTFLVPTLYVVDMDIESATRNAPEKPEWVDHMLQSMQQEVSGARQLGIKMAAGFDTTSTEMHGKNALELTAMVKRGLTPNEAIQAATINAAELMGWRDQVGVLEAGHYADIIAVEGDPLKDVVLLQNIAFVMKGGVLIKPQDHVAEGNRGPLRFQ